MTGTNERGRPPGFIPVEAMVKSRLIQRLGETAPGTLIRDQNGNWVHGCIECGLAIFLVGDHFPILLGETYKLNDLVICPRCGIQYTIGNDGEVDVVQARSSGGS